MVALTCTLSQHFSLAHLSHTRLPSTRQCVVMELGLKCDGCTHMHTLSSPLTAASFPHLSVRGKRLEPEMPWSHSHAHSPPLLTAHLPRSRQCVARGSSLKCGRSIHTHTLTPPLIGSSPSHLPVCGNGLGPEMRWLHSHSTHTHTL